MMKLGQAFDLNQIKLRIEKAREAGNNSSSVLQKYKCSKCRDEGVTIDTSWNHNKEYPIPYETSTIRHCDCQGETKVSKFNASAGLSKVERKRSFETAIIDDSNETQFRTAVDFVKNIERNLESGGGLYIYGDQVEAARIGLSAYGTGKTYMLNCIANELCKMNVPAIYVTEYDLFQDIKRSYDKSNVLNEAQVLERYFEVPVLMIDDLFSDSYTEWSESRLFSILNYRDRNQKVTFVTSNYSPDRVSLRLPINGAKIVSRILGGYTPIMMIGKDRRIISAIGRR